MRLARSLRDSAGLSLATNADRSKEPDRRLRLGLRDLDDRECGGEFTGAAGAASFITRMPLLHVGRMRGTVLSCCCLGALASPGCLGDPLVPALPRTVTPVLGLNHSLRHLRRTRGLEANARDEIWPSDSLAFGLGLPFLALRGSVECFEDTGDDRVTHNILAGQVNDAHPVNALQPVDGIGKPGRLVVRQVHLAEITGNHHA